MASLCKRQICTNAKHGVNLDLDSWRCSLIRCVGIEKILELLHGTKVVEDLRLFKDYKPASVSNWFDENCLFCCLRREKVKEHVVALNNKIVESGGKPLLGKDHSNIRLECQVEEFLNAVLHRKEYTPRIPDPHIPVVACDAMQQMIGQLVVHYTSNDSQGSPRHNGNTDQSLLKARTITSPTVAATAIASAQNPVLSKLLMADQDTPLDLSLKKVKPEIAEQDGVLDLSIKKNRNQDGVSPKKPQMNFTTSFSTRDSLDLGLAKVRDLQSVSGLEHFMAKLCLHHQRQIIDAFGFLQTEVKDVASSSNCEVSSSAVPEPPPTSGCSQATFEERSEIQASEEMHTLSGAISKTGVHEPAFEKSTEPSPAEQPSKPDGSVIPSFMTGPPLDLSKIGIGPEDLSSSVAVGVGDGSTKFQPKCPTLLIVKNRNSGNLEAKNISEVDSVIQQNTGTLEQDQCTSDTQLQAAGSEAGVIELSSLSLGHERSEPKYCTVQRSLPAHGNDSTVRHCSDQRTSKVISPIFQRTARKSRRASRLRQRDSLNDPDINCDIVYVGKPITECERQSHHSMLPRKNARKSTRGHLYIGECWEVKTVRTMAGKSADIGSGNCHVPIPEMTTSVTPKQALAKPDGVPPMDIPFTGDCMETVMNKKSSDQPVETEMPGDVVEIENDHLIVETSQTGQTQIKERISSVLASDQNDASVQHSSNARTHGSIVDDGELGAEQGKPMDVANINGPTENVEPAKESLEALVTDVISDGLANEIPSQNVATASLSDMVSSDIAKDDRSNAEGMGVKSELKGLNATTNNFQTETLQQTECLEMPVGTYTDDKNAELPITGGTEANLQTEEDGKLTQDKIVDSQMPDLNLDEAAIKEMPKEGPELNALGGFSTKKVTPKHAFSGRCLRSRTNQKIVTETSGPNELDDLQSDVRDLNAPESKRPLKSSKSKPTEEDVPCTDGQNGENATENVEKTPRSSDVSAKMDMVCTRQKQRLIMNVKEAEIDKEQMILEFPKSEPKLEPHGMAENVGVTPPEADKSLENKVPGKSLRVSERMPLRNRSGQNEQSSSRASCSTVKIITQTSERMPSRTRSGSAADQPIVGDFGCSPAGGHLERMPLRSGNGCVADEIVSKDSSISPGGSNSECVTRLPPRSKNSATDQQVSEESPDAIADSSGSLTEQPISDDLCITSKKMESTGHMPLRSGNVSVAEQPSNSSSCALTVGNASESPGRMSLRRSNTSIAEKSDHLATPPKIKKLSQRQPPRLSKISLPSSDLEAEQNHSIAKCKTDKPFRCRMKDSSLPENSLVSVNLPSAGPAIPCQSRFLEALTGEENQHLISDLNTKFEKMQKGWVQMDKEGQPAPRPRNRADRLKEIWKSKRRIRKPRSLEQQKFSPVQTLFMRSFDLPSICRWFLQTTETKSLVIVKKVNTRLPSETQLCFHTSASVPGTSNGVFPSLQAERLKKHLKKFAIASPVKSNPKTKRLIAKALAQDVSISQGKEKRESIAATRISTKPHSYTSLIQTQLPETHSKGTVVVKNPASARILRKYSNMREKMQVQQNTLKHLGSSHEETKQAHLMPKNVSKEKLSTGRGQKSVIVKKVKALAKKVKGKSSVKVRIPKRSVSRALRDLNDKDGVLPKGTLPKVAKFNPVTATKTLSKKETLTKNDKSPQPKQDIKKSPLSKVSDLSPSQNASMKPLSEDQVLTRSQRKIEATLSQTVSPKTTIKRGTEPLVSSAKRTRTSK